MNKVDKADTTELKTNFFYFSLDCRYFDDCESSFLLSYEKENINTGSSFTNAENKYNSSKLRRV